MISIFICDDVKKTAQFYLKELELLSIKHCLTVTYKYFSSGEKLVEYVNTNPNEADIIYLDIIMQQLNGIETAQNLRKLGCEAQIIFLTSSEEYVFDSFNTRPLDYLLKDDVSSARFEEVFLKAVSHSTKREKDSYLIESNGALHRIPLSSILLFKVNNRIITAYYEASFIDFYGKLEEIEADLRDKGFMRTNRSHLVNCQYIKNFAQNNVILSTGEKIPVSMTKAKELKQTFSKFLLGN